MLALILHIFLLPLITIIIYKWLYKLLHMNFYQIIIYPFPIVYYNSNDFRNKF